MLAEKFIDLWLKWEIQKITLKSKIEISEELINQIRNISIKDRKEE